MSDQERYHVTLPCSTLSVHALYVYVAIFVGSSGLHTARYSEQNNDRISVRYRYHFEFSILF